MKDDSARVRSPVPVVELFPTCLVNEIHPDACCGGVGGVR